MKIYKLLFLTVLSCFALSCSQDKLEDQTLDESSDRLTASQFDNSYLGLYKGLFTTNDGMTRGSVEISISQTNGAFAQIKLSTGELIELKSSKAKITLDNTIENLIFSSEGLSSTEVSMKFSVEGNGLNPSISDVRFDNKESNILVAKNLSRVPLTPITGTFNCTDCSSQGVGFPNNRTWNVMSVGSGNQNYMVQVSYFNRVYTSAGTQDGCFSFMGYDVCTIEGSLEVLGFDVSWDGTHIYDGSDSLACSEVEGVWSAPGYGPGVSGTFQSDSDCDTSLRVLACGEFLVDNGGDSNDYANNSSDTYRINAGAGNTLSLEFSEFNTENFWDDVVFYDGADTSAPEITNSFNNVAAGSGRNGGYSGGDLSGDKIVSSGQFMTVLFRSDSSVTRPGFMAEVVCVSGRAALGQTRTSLTFRPETTTNAPIK